MQGREGWCCGPGAEGGGLLRGAVAAARPQGARGVPELLCTDAVAFMHQSRPSVAVQAKPHPLAASEDVLASFVRHA